MFDDTQSLPGTSMRDHLIRVIPPDASSTSWIRELQIELREAIARNRGRGLHIGCVLIQPDGWEEGALQEHPDAYRHLFGRVLDLVRQTEHDHVVSGLARGRRVLVLIPHGATRQVQEFCGEVVDRARGLPVPGCEPSRHVTLSMGVATPDAAAGGGTSINMLIGQAGTRLEAAIEQGGDRIVAGDPRQPPVDERPEVSTAAPPSSEGAAEETLRELAFLREQLAEASHSTEALYKRRIGVLERRVAKLRTHLLTAERELKLRPSSVVAADDGRASVYRGVQGLDEDAEAYEEKMGLLTSIFEANAELRGRSPRARSSPSGGGNGVDRRPVRD